MVRESIPPFPQGTCFSSPDPRNSWPWRLPTASEVPPPPLPRGFLVRLPPSPPSGTGPQPSLSLLVLRHASWVVESFLSKNLHHSYSKRAIYMSIVLTHYKKNILCGLKWSFQHIFLTHLSNKICINNNSWKEILCHSDGMEIFSLWKWKGGCSLKDNAFLFMYTLPSQ